MLLWLESALADRGVHCGRYAVEAGLEDLELQDPTTGAVHRLRITRTGSHDLTGSVRGHLHPPIASPT